MPPDSSPRADGASRFLRPLSIAAGIVIVDQATKLVIRERLAPYQTIPVIDGLLNIVHARNPGAAFSFLADAPTWFRAPFFLVVTTVAIVVLLYAISRLPRADRLMRVALGAVLGGALGNLIDRVLYGEVTDFIDVHWRGHHWPAFNVADSSISVAVVAVILQSLLLARSEGDAPARL